MNSFTGANTKFANKGIHAMLSEVIKFRKQLVVRPEFKSQSGWTNALNAYMVEELEKLSDTLEHITYNPDPTKTKDQLEAEAADTTRTLAQDHNAQALASDNVLGPPAREWPLPWDLSGNDVDIPQVDPKSMPNDWARSFVVYLDEMFVQLTQLDSRFQPVTITKFDSALIRNTYLAPLFSLCQRKGGEVNKSDIPAGTLPSQLPLTWNFGGAVDGAPKK